MTTAVDRPPAPSGALSPSLAILVAVTAINPLALNIYVPSMPSVQDTFAAPASIVQLTLSLGLVGTALIQIVVGPMSDQFGRRPVLLTGLVFALIASVYCAVAGSIEGLIIGRIIQIAGGAAGLVLGRAIVRDLHEPKDAASMLGYVTMGMAMAPMVAPTIGGMLDDFFNWRAGFVFSSVITAIVLVASWYTLPETNVNRGSASSLGAFGRDVRELVTMRTFWIYTMTISFVGATFFAFVGGAPYVGDHIFGLSKTQYGLFFMLVAIGYAVGNYISGRFASRAGLFRMILLGSLLTAIFCFAIVLLSLIGIENAPMLFGAMFFVGLGNGLVFPSCIAGVVSVNPRLAGSASGLSGCIMMGINAAFSYFVAFLLSDSLLPMALLMTASAVVAVGFSLLVPRSVD
ncbi:MFS transporter, DHA1 family, bicyclomycin/chloramphenicol resistance protein [Cohaesibacter sp. ES.047]|uniref:multidrug effflux MFS transporter n=1 Tax=Cohaesibacter sp. ES.047 TaxID=1798205 RepID=UPI000BBFDBAE|nr:multidrug effflux MFS transporter [Cohaesibacter sp. ES.047]SNY93027.1 MFS transporter, DHA1 family, bicyclomycin/chloramphenicol resistance protein [Cohaesibacter sp. ES.047]